MSQFSTPSLALPGPQIILALINNANLTQFQLSDLLFGAPAAAAGVAGPRNTDLLVSAAGSTTWQGSKLVNYDRLALGTLFANKNVQLEYAANYHTTLDLLPVINATFGLGMSSDDIVSAALPALGSSAVQVTLTAKSTSLVYTGTYQLTLVPDGVTPPGNGTVQPFITVNAALGAPFLDGSNKILLDTTLANGNFNIVNNDEVQVAVRAYGTNGGPVAIDNTGAVAITLAHNDSWHAEILAAVGAGKTLLNLYNVDVTVTDLTPETGGVSVDLTLTHDGSGFHWVNAGEAISLNATYSAADASQVGEKLDIHAALSAAFPTSATAGTSAFGGQWSVAIKATKIGASVPVVTATVVATLTASA